MASPSTDTLLALKYNLRAIVYEAAFPLVLETALLVVHVVLTMNFVYQRWIHRKTTPFADIWLYTVFVMLALLSAYWAIDVYILWEATDLSLRMADASESAPVVATVSNAMLSQLPRNAQLAIILLILIIGDCIALWRAYVIYGRPKWLRASCTALAIAIIMFQSAMLGVRRLRDAVATIPAIGELTTCIPHVVSTSLIARKAWLHRKDVREFAHQTGARYSLAVLAVVIESGIAYLLLYMIYVAVTLGALSGTYVQAYNFFTPLAAMYPILVLLLVAARKSLLERTIELVSIRNIMRFADVATETHRSRADTEHGPEYATLTRLGASDHGSPLRVEDSLGSTVEMGNAVMVRKESSVHSEDRSEVGK